MLSVAVRGKLKSSAEFNPGYPGLLTAGLDSKETYGYRGIISDCVRGVDFLRSRPEIDPERIFACGSSQGGGLTLITSALRPEVFALDQSFALAIAARRVIIDTGLGVLAIDTQRTDECENHRARRPYRDGLLS